MLNFQEVINMAASVQITLIICITLLILSFKKKRGEK